MLHLPGWSEYGEHFRAVTPAGLGPQRARHDAMIAFFVHRLHVYIESTGTPAIFIYSVQADGMFWRGSITMRTWLAQSCR